MASAAAGSGNNNSNKMSPRRRKVAGAVPLHSSSRRRAAPAAASADAQQHQQQKPACCTHCCRHLLYTWRLHTARATYGICGILLFRCYRSDQVRPPHAACPCHPDHLLMPPAAPAAQHLLHAACAAAAVVQVRPQRALPHAMLCCLPRATTSWHAYLAANHHEQPSDGVTAALTTSSSVVSDARRCGGTRSIQHLHKSCAAYNVCCMLDILA